LQVTYVSDREENMSNFNWKAASVLSALIFCATLMPAHSQQGTGLSQEVVAAAKAEGVLTLYTAQDDLQTNRTIAAFNILYPEIKVEFLHPGPSNVVISRFLQESESQVYVADIVNTQTTQLYTDHEKLWVDLSQDNFPILSERKSELFGKNYIATVQTPLMFAYNKNQLAAADIPKTWEDLLDPKYVGRGIMTDPRNTDSYAHWFDQIEKRYGKEFLEKLSKQDFRIVASGGQGSQELASGGGPDFIFPVFATLPQPLILKGAPLEMVGSLSEASGMPAIVNVSYFGITKSAPHPNAARLFLSFLLTEEGQKANCSPGANAALFLSADNHGDCLLPLGGDLLPASAAVPAERKAELFEAAGLK